MKLLLRLAASLACLAACAAALAFVWPNARDAAAIFLSQDDPAALSELQIRKAAAGDPQLVEREIEAALTDGDIDLAQSFVDLAQAQNLPVSVDVLARLETVAAEQRSATHLAGPVCDRLPDRRHRRPRKLLRDRDRRPVRLRRYPRHCRSGAATGAGRGAGPAGARSRRGRACRDRRNLRVRWHGHARARRSHPAEGRAQERPAQRRADRLGAAVRDRGGRFRPCCGGRSAMPRWFGRWSRSARSRLRCAPRRRGCWSLR